MTSDFCSPFLAAIWNQEFILNKNFSQKVKLADITQVYQKEDSIKVKHFRPFSVLPTLSKIFKLMQKRISKYINPFLAHFLCGYRKGYSTEAVLVWLDKNDFAGAILMDFSKAFDTINYHLLIAKLQAYGFGKIDLVYSYLKNRKQRLKVNATFTTWIDLISGVPQGSVLGLLLFNIYLNDLFFFLQDINICNLADETTPFVCDETLESVLDELEGNSELVKLNTDKYEHSWAKIGDDKIWEISEVELLGVTIDNQLKFDSHISTICFKGNQKRSALSRLMGLLTFDRKLLESINYMNEPSDLYMMITKSCSRTFSQ